MGIIKKSRGGKVVLLYRGDSPNVFCRIKIPDVSGWWRRSTGVTDVKEAQQIAEEWHDEIRFKAKHGLAIEPKAFSAVTDNEVGLEILDGYEEQWAAAGSLSDRQQSWLDRQLDGTWRPVGSNRRPDAVEIANPAPSEEAELLDAIIERRMADNGKTLVDADQVERLKKAISDLSDVLRDVRI